MKRKKSLLIVILLVFVIGGVSAYFGGMWLLQHRAARWRNEGIAASVAGEHDKAVILLTRYFRRHADIQKEDKNEVSRYMEALKYYVSSLEQTEPPHFAEALAALKLQVGRTDSLEDRRHLLRLYVKLERRPEALDAADAILSRKEWAADVETLELKSQTLAELLRDREALTVAESWVKAAPLDVKAHMAVLSLRSHNGRSAKSIIDDAEELRKNHPGDARFEFLVGYAYGLFADDPDSRHNAAAALKTASAHPDLSEDLARLIITEFDTLGMPDESLGMLQALVARGAGPGIRHTLAPRFWELGRWGATAELLGDLNPSDPAADPTLLAMKAISAANLGKAGESAAVRSALTGRKQAAAQAWTLLLRRIIDGANLDDKEVVAKCRAALAVEQRNSYLQYYLGDSEIRLKEFELAEQAWRIAAIENPTWGLPATRWVEVLLRLGKTEEARWVAYEAYRHSHTAGPAIAMARAYAASLSAGGAGQADQLLQMTSEILDKIPGEEATLLIRIQLLAKTDKAQAVKTAREGLARTPPPGEAFILAVATLSRQFALGIEKECFARCEQAHGMTAALAYGRATDHLLSSPPDAAAGLRQFDELAARSGKAQDWEWRLKRATYLDVTGDSGAKAAWESLGAAFPDRLEVQTAVSSARAVQGDWDIGLPTIDRLHKLEGDAGLYWRLAEARLLVLSGRNESDYEKGSLRLSDIIKEYPSMPEPRVLLAQALIHLKSVDGAIEQLSVASKLDPYSVPISLQLAALLQKRGDFDRAQQELDRVTPQLHSAAQIRQAAILLAQQGNSSGATQLLEHAQTQPSGGRDPSEDLLLAILYRRRGEFDKCDALLKKLLEHPNFAVIQFAASYYGSRGRHAEAEVVLAKLDSLKLDPGIKELTWGSYCVEKGDLPGAAKYYQAATVAAPANPVSWRLLATVQAMGGNIDAALATVDRALSALPADAAMKAIRSHGDVLRKAGGADELRSVVLLIVRDPLNSDTAAELLGWLIDARATNDMELLASRLQQLTERLPGFLPGQIQLANCLAAMGRRQEALSVAQHAITAFPDNPEPTRLAVQLCAASGRWSEMEAAAHAWRTRAPDDLAADIALAQAEMGLRHYESAMSQLRPHLDDAKADPERYVDLLSTYYVCAVKSDLTQMQMAADQLWPWAQKYPDWRVHWVVVAVAMDDVHEAVNWLDRVSAIIPASEFTQRVAVAEALDLLGEKSRDGQLKQRSVEAFAQICNEPNVTPAALLAAGAAAERRGDTPSAELLYRRAVNLDSGEWIAQNNLAVLMARSGGDVKEAAAHAAAAAQLQPRKATIRDTLAEVQAKGNDLKAASDSERMAIKLEPLNAKWRVRLAQYLLKANDYSGSAQAVQALDDRRLDFRDFPAGEQKVLTKQLEDIRIRLGGKKN